MPIIVGIVVVMFLAFMAAGGAGGIVLVATAIGGVVWVALVFVWTCIRLVWEIVWGILQWPLGIKK